MSAVFNRGYQQAVDKSQTLTQLEPVAALATAPGRGAIAVIRASGQGIFGIADKIARPRGGKKLSDYPPRTAVLCDIVSPDGVKLDEGLCITFASPRSYTGEDSVELYLHGGRAVAASALDAMYTCGARPAGPGEFTRRALLNGKLDLTAAEAVGEIIDASDPRASAAAASRLDGSLGRSIRAIREKLIGAAAHYTACIEYEDEGVEPPDGAEVEELCTELCIKIARLVENCRRGELLRDGVASAIIGRANAGKSSIMNLLLGRERAIVTDIPGTTRDVLEEEVVLGGVKLRLSDTAGLRNTQDPVEKLGVERGKKTADASAIVLAVFDASDAPSQDDRLTEQAARRAAGNGAAVIKLLNKSDVIPGELSQAVDNYSDFLPECRAVTFSAETGEGYSALAEAVSDAVGTAREPEPDIISVRRQADCLRRAGGAMDEYVKAYRSGFSADVLVTLLTDAVDALGELTGDSTTDDLLDRVFRDFCVGK